MNIKSLLGKIQWRRDLIRLWVAGTVAWAALWLLVAGIYPQPLTAAQLEDFVLIFVGVPAFFWALLFGGFVNPYLGGVALWIGDLNSLPSWLTA